MYNYSMMSPMMNPMMMSGYSQYGGGGNAYINMRAQYGYPYLTHDYPPTPMTPAKREPHVIIERNRFLNFLKKIF